MIAVVHGLVAAFAASPQTRSPIAQAEFPIIEGEPERDDDSSGSSSTDPSMDLDAVAPADPLIERSESEPPPSPAAKLQDLLKKHQARDPDDDTKR